MLLGAHEHSLDDKNRLTLPARLREQLGGRLVVARGLDGCLVVYSAPDWERLRERIAQLDPLSAEARTMRRWFFGYAGEAELDKQGRIVIPGGLLERLGIGREVTVLGMDDHLEVWDRAAWREEEQRVEGSAEDVAQRLADRD